MSWSSLEGVGSQGLQGLLCRTGHRELRPAVIARCSPSPEGSCCAQWLPRSCMCSLPKRSPHPHSAAGCLSVVPFPSGPLSHPSSRSNSTGHKYCCCFQKVPWSLPEGRDLYLLSSHCPPPLSLLPGKAASLGPTLGGQGWGAAGGEGRKWKRGEVHGHCCVPALLREIAPAKPLNFFSLPDGACVGGFC